MQKKREILNPIEVSFSAAFKFFALHDFFFFLRVLFLCCDHVYALILKESHAQSFPCELQRRKFDQSLENTNARTDVPQLSDHDDDSLVIFLA